MMGNGGVSLTEQEQEILFLVLQMALERKGIDIDEFAGQFFCSAECVYDHLGGKISNSELAIEIHRILYDEKIRINQISEITERFQYLQATGLPFIACNGNYHNREEPEDAEDLLA